MSGARNRPDALWAVSLRFSGSPIGCWHYGYNGDALTCVCSGPGGRVIVTVTRASQPNALLRRSLRRWDIAEVDTEHGRSTHPQARGTR